MSFSDLMSSARGPGVIGLLLAMVVLLGFTGLFIFAFDDNLQGGKVSIDAAIRMNHSEILSHKERIAQAEKRLEQRPALLTNTRKHDELRRKAKISQESIRTSRELTETLNGEIDGIRSDFEKYKDQYRDHIRSLEIGKTYDRIETEDGAVYTNVEVRGVSAVGIQIRHSEGLKRISFENLSKEIQDHLQYDPSQKETALAQEAAVRAHHDQQAGIAAEAAAQKREEFRQQELAREKEKVARNIAMAESSIVRLQSEIEQLQNDLASARAAAAAARTRGNMHLDQSGPIQRKIQSRRNQISNLQRQIAQFRSSTP